MCWHLAKPARLPLSISFTSKSSSQISTKPAWTSMEIHAALRTYTRGEKCKMTSEWLSANDVHIVQSSSALQLMEENTQDALRCLKDCESMCVCELSNELKERERGGAYERFGLCVCLWVCGFEIICRNMCAWLRRAERERESVCLFSCVCVWEQLNEFWVGLRGRECVWTAEAVSSSELPLKDKIGCLQSSSL